jgi:FecR protein
MLYGRSHAFLTLVVLTLLTVPAGGQSVISTHSGVIHFFEGAVYVGEQPLESHPGRFSSVPQGAVLRTADGRAEVLLTPGVFIRVGERSAIRMVANTLSNTRVELLAGSAIVDSAESTPDASVTLLYKNWTVRSHEQGAYRIDSDPPHLWVLKGEAEVSSGERAQALLVKQGMDVPFEPVLVPEQSIGQPRDALSSWAEGRQQSISTDNAIAANIQDPATMTATNPGYDAFTQFPMLGLSSLGPGWTTPYDAYLTYQPGFNSVYLPGYNYLPFLVGLYAGGFSKFGPLTHSGGLVLPRRPVLYPRPGLPGSSGGPHLSSFSSHPVPGHPVSTGHSASPGGVHVGAHR